MENKRLNPSGIENKGSSAHTQAVPPPAIPTIVMIAPPGEVGAGSTAFAEAVPPPLPPAPTSQGKKG